MIEESDEAGEYHALEHLYQHRRERDWAVGLGQVARIALTLSQKELRDVGSGPARASTPCFQEQL